MARACNGTSQYLQSAATLDLSAVTQITVCIWAYWTSTPSADTILLETSANLNSNTAAFILDHYGTGFYVSLKTATGYNDADVAAEPTTSAWHHIAVSFDRNGGANQVVAIYFDGVNQSFSKGDSNTSSTGGFGNFTWNVGSRNGASLFAPVRVAELAVFTGRNLSVNEITNLAAGGRVQDLEPAHYWRLDGDDSPEPNWGTSRTALTVTGATKANHAPISMSWPRWEDAGVGRDFALVDKLSVYYPCDEASGDIIDAHHARNLSEVSGTIASAAGKVGTSRQFAAADTEYASVANHEDLSLSSTLWTIALWVYLDSTANQSILGKFGDPSYEYLLAIDSGVFRISPDASASLSSSVTLSTGQWYFVCARWNGLTLKLRVNTTEDTTSFTTGTPAGTSPFLIGARGDVGTAALLLDGRVDEVGIWKRYLSDAHVDDIYNGNAGRNYAYIFGAGGTTFTVNPIETLGLSRAYARTSNANRVHTDSTATNDSYSRTSTGNRVCQDATGIVDAYARLSDAKRVEVDSLGINDPYQRVSDALRRLTDTLGLTDVVALTVGTAYLVQVVESLGISEAYQRFSDASRALSDNTFGFIDVYARLSDAKRSLTPDTVGINDPYARQSIANRINSDTTGWTDDYARTSDGKRNLNDSLGINDPYQRVSDALRRLTESLGITDATTLVKVSAGVLTLTVVELLGLTEEYGRVIDAKRTNTESLGINDLYHRTSTGNRVGVESLGITDIYAREAVWGRGGLVESLGINDSIQRTANGLRAVTDPFGVNDAYSRTVIIVHALSLLDVWGATEAYSRQASARRAYIDWVGLAELVTAITPLIDPPEQRNRLDFYHGEGPSRVTLDFADVEESLNF